MIFGSNRRSINHGPHGLGPGGTGRSPSGLQGGSIPVSGILSESAASGSMLAAGSVGGPSMQTWEEFRKKSTRLARDSRRRPSREADLDQFEAATGLKLPGSYRGFATTFGPCSVGKYMIAAPRPRKRKVPGDWLELAILSRELHDNLVAYTRPIAGRPRSVDPARTLRTVFFATDGGSGSYGWDPEEVGDARGHEYAVYVRYSEGRPYERLASSFGEFVQVYCVEEDRRSRREDRDWDADDPRIMVRPC